MKKNFVAGVANANANVNVTSWASLVAGSVAPAAHPMVATHDAIAATKRRAAATVASVNRGTF